MSEFKLTEGQKEAVYSRGGSILVSAAAGSGKTRVLVERLMSYITDETDPCDITDFLIITYTRAAAAELRSRILEEITARIAKGNMSLRRQQTLCYRASIGTIHSFCGALLRERSHSLKLPGDFKVIEQEKGRELKELILMRLLEQRYETIVDDKGFALLVDTVGAGLDDMRLGEIVLKIHEKMQSHPEPEVWAREQIAAMDLSECGDLSETLWGSCLLENARETALYWKGRLEKTVAGLEGSKSGKMLLKGYGASIGVTIGSLGAFALAADWDSVLKCLPIEFPRLGRLPEDFDDNQLAESFKALRDMCKSSVKKLGEDFTGTSQKLLSDLEFVRPAAEALLMLVLDFDKLYAKEKQRLGYADFSDLEHMAWELLKPLSDGMKSPAAEEVSQGYREIMIDEYQDVNKVQDSIFYALSRDGENLFMVGDVKQSIYRFRLADPGIFIEKYNSFKGKGTAGRRILLQENFRSRGCVLDAANHLFENIMSSRLGDTDYDEDARLKMGAVYSGKEHIPEIDIIELPDSGSDEESVEKSQAEAMHIARRINWLIAEREMVETRGGLRPADYGDMVILMRSPGTAGAVYKRVLTDMGIPVQAPSGGGFFEAVEIQSAVAMLEAVDNPYNDIALISVLRSPMFMLSGDELSKVRTGDRELSFYEGLLQSTDESEVCREFIELLHMLRDSRADMPVDMLLWEIYTKTGLLSAAGAMEGGSLRSRRLMALFELALQYGQSGYKDVHGFVGYLNGLKSRGQEPDMPAGQSKAVRIMSIHKSKGLEFPIVFLANTAKRFNKLDASQTVLMDSKLGLGLKLTDLDRGIEYPTAARRAVARRIVQEGLSEEMRILYVAVTRAKERLFISCAMKTPERTLEKLRLTLEHPIPPVMLESAQSMSHWILQAALLDPGEQFFKLNIVQADGTLPSGADFKDLDVKYTKEQYDEVSRRLSYVYPHMSHSLIPAKITATELKGRAADEKLRDDAQEVEIITVPRLRAREAEIITVPEFRRPDFLKDSLTPAQRGNALHLVMQHIDIAKAGSLEAVKGEIQRIRSEGRLTDAEVSAVSAENIYRFFGSEIGLRLQKAEKVWREFRFSLISNGGRYYPEAEGEEILMQGIVDICFVEKGNLVIVDFKTDYVTEDTIESKAGMYKGQLYTYADAMSRILDMPAAETIVYFMGAGKGILL